MTIVLLCNSARAHRDRVLPPQSFSVAFASGNKVTFEVTNARVAAITVQVGSTVSQVPHDVCAKLRDVRFETVRLLWNGSYKTAAEADYYYVIFNMGPVINRPNADPPVELMFHHGKFTRMHQEP